MAKRRFSSNRPRSDDLSPETAPQGSADSSLDSDSPGNPAEETPRPEDLPPSDLGEPDDLRQQLADAKDLALRATAELDNFRKRSRRQLEDERKYADLPMMRALLPVLDNIDRAIGAADMTKDSDALLEGVKLVAKQLEDILRQRQCLPIDALHAPFDPNQHEAISMRPDAEHPANAVVDVVQPGFQLHDRVVRPTQVIVSTGKPD